MRRVTGWFVVIFLTSALMLGQVAALASNPANHRPDANNDQITTAFNTSVTFTKTDLLANDADSSGHTFTFDGVTRMPGAGTLTLVGDTFTYVPASNSSQDQDFEYQIRDSVGMTDTATVTLKISEPVAVSDTFTVFAGVPTFINVLANDIGQGLAVGDVSQAPHHGSFDGTTLTYTSDSSFIGQDSFKYKLAHADHGNPVWVYVNVVAKPVKPVLTINTAVVGGTLLSVQPIVTDSTGADRGPGSITITNGSGSGSADLVAGEYTIDANPPAGFTAVISGATAGHGSFTAQPDGNYTVTITYGAKASLTIATLVVGGPLAQVQPTVTDAAGTDVWPGPIVLTEGSGAATIGLAADAGQTYTIDANTPAGYTAYIEGLTERTVSFGVTAGGEYAFIIKYTFNDLQPPTTTEATLTINTIVVGNPPEAPFEPKVGDTIVTPGNAIKLTAGTYTIDANAPANYTAVINGFEGSIASLPVAAGGDYGLTITYTYAPTYPLTVKVQVVGDTDALSTGIFTVLIEQQDPDLDVWHTLDTITGVVDGAELLRNVPAGTYRVTELTPLPTGYTLVSTSDAVTIGSEVGSATLTVTNRYTAPVTPPPQQLNTAPVAIDDTATTSADDAIVITVLANDLDADGDALTVTITTQPTGGTVTVADDKITYTPNAGFAGQDSFTYTISDGRGGSSTATVKVTVAAKAPTDQSEVVIDEPIPGGGAALPKTGGVDPVMFYGIGLAAVVLGAALRKQNDEE